MMSAALDIALGLLKPDLKHSMRRLTATAVLLSVAAVMLLVAAGFGLSLLYVWLRAVEGTMAALAIIAGGLALVGLLVLAIGLWRPRRRAPYRVPPHRAAAHDLAGGERMIEDAIAGLQQGSRESMLTAIVLAAVTGVLVGRKL